MYAGEKYHQYDNFVYPKALKSRRGLWTSIKRFFGGLSDEKSEYFTLTPTDEMIQQCLLFYLEPFKDVLLNDRAYPDEFRIHEFVRKVKLLFQQHEVPAVQDQNPAQIKSVSCV